MGTEGTARVERPWLSVECPTRVRTERDNVPAARDFEPTNAYCSMIEHFARGVREGRGAEPWPAEDGAAQARVMEAAIRSATRQGEPFPV